MYHLNLTFQCICLTYSVSAIRNCVCFVFEVTPKKSPLTISQFWMTEKYETHSFWWSSLRYALFWFHSLCSINLKKHFSRGESSHSHSATEDRSKNLFIRLFLPFKTPNPSHCLLQTEYENIYAPCVLFHFSLLSFFSFIASKVYLAKMSSGRGNRESGRGEIFTLFDRARSSPKGGCQSGLIEKERESRKRKGPLVGRVVQKIVFTNGTDGTITTRFQWGKHYILFEML